MAKGAKLKQDEHFPDYTVGANCGKYKIVALYMYRYMIIMSQYSKCID